MQNIHSLSLFYVPKTLDNHFPKLERVTLKLDFIRSDEEVHSLVSFFRSNRQIKYLKLSIMKPDYNDLIYSAIEENLAQLKMTHYGTHRRNAMEPIPTYRLKTIEKFSFSCSDRPNNYSFEFDELKKITFESELNSKWLNFLSNNKKVKILKIFLANKYCSKKVNCNTVVKESSCPS